MPPTSTAACCTAAAAAASVLCCTVLYCRAKYYSTDWGVVELLTTCLFAADIAVKFFVGAPDMDHGGAIAMDQRRVAQLYIR